MALGDLGIIERLREPDEDRVVGLAERAGVAAARAEHLLAVEQALGEEEADRELGLVAGRPHRDRDRDRVLARSGGADLERRLADDAVVADLERFAADRHDPVAGHVPDGRRRVAGQAGHVVASSAVPERCQRIAGDLGGVEGLAERAQAGETAAGLGPGDEGVGGRSVRVEHRAGGGVGGRVAVGRRVVAQPVAFGVHEIKDIDRGVPRRRPDPAPARPSSGRALRLSTVARSSLTRRRNAA